MHRVTRLRSLLDGSAESPGESLARLLFVGLGLDFRAQVDIPDAAGFAGRAGAACAQSSPGMPRGRRGDPCRAGDRAAYPGVTLVTTIRTGGARWWAALPLLAT